MNEDAWLEEAYEDRSGCPGDKFEDEMDYDNGDY